MSNNFIFDGFLEDFEGFREHLDGVDYAGMTNPTDNIFYPGVSIDIPEAIKSEVLAKLQTRFKTNIKCNAMFLRLSPEGVDAPHQAHTDVTMGKFGMLLYLNRNEHCLGGTSFVYHKQSGLAYNPINELQQTIWEGSTNSPNSWGVLDICPMIPNRALVFNTDRMHRAEPVGGFGEGNESARLVLVMFFDADD